MPGMRIGQGVLTMRAVACVRVVSGVLGRRGSRCRSRSRRVIVVLVLRRERRCARQRQQGQRGFHFALSGPITVTVCIIPPCMW